MPKGTLGLWRATTYLQGNMPSFLGVFLDESPSMIPGSKWGYRGIGTGAGGIGTGVGDKGSGGGIGT